MIPSSNIRCLDIDPSLIVQCPDTQRGSYCFIAHSPELEEILEEMYGRSGLCLKVFTAQLIDEVWLEENKVEDYGWNHVSLLETTRVQNLFAFHGAAPRVYDIVVLGRNQQIAQVTTYVESKDEERQDVLLRKLIKDYQLATIRNWDIGDRNWRSGLFVDFGGIRFGNPEWYEKTLIEKAHVYGNKRRESRPYQTIDELQVEGSRSFASRIRDMHLEEVSFEGKTVLDIGCNLGSFCRYALERGAKRVVGIDKYKAEDAQELANWLGNWNADYLALDLPAQRFQLASLCGIAKFDIVFLFSTIKYVGSSWIPEFCKPDSVVIVEGHGNQPAQKYAGALTPDFHIKSLSATNDNKKRAVFHCKPRPKTTIKRKGGRKMLELRMENMTPEDMFSVIAEEHPEMTDRLERARTRVPFLKREVWLEQAAVMYTLAKQFDIKGARILEIGTAWGYSAAVMAEAAPLATITTLNPKHSEMHYAVQHLAEYTNIDPIEITSWEYYRNYNGPLLDMVFIDGNHQLCYRDFPWWSWIAPGGLMLWHDYSPEDASKRPCVWVYEFLNAMRAGIGRDFDVLAISDVKVGIVGWYKQMEEMTGAFDFPLPKSVLTQW